MNLSKLTYLLLPPLVSKLALRAKNRMQKRKKIETRQLRIDLDKLRHRGWSYFFDDKVVREFCDHLEHDARANQPIGTAAECNGQYLEDLLTKGYCVIKGQFEDQTIREWHDMLKPRLTASAQRCEELVAFHGLASMRNIQEMHHGDKTNFELVSGIARMWDVHISHPDLIKFHQNPVIRDVVGSYFGGNLNESSVYVEYKSKINRFDPNIHYHADSPFRLLKVWLLLNDVGPMNAPLVYCEKTHNINDWRILRDLLEFSKYNKKHRASYAHFSRMELAHLANDFNDMCMHEKQVTGKAGDIIIADTRGVHGGTNLMEGYRLQLGMVFTGLGNHSIDEVPDRVKKLSRDSL